MPLIFLMRGTFSAADFFQNFTFSKNTSVSNSFSVSECQIVSPDFCQNCLQRLSADDKSSKERVHTDFEHFHSVLDYLPALPVTYFLISVE